MRLLHIVLPDYFFAWRKHKKRMREITKNKKIPHQLYEEFLKKKYIESTGYSMDFSNPITMTQKQQWLKLYDCSREKQLLSDKYTVRKFVEEKIGNQVLVPLIVINGIDHFYNAFDIDFDLLPSQFVLKCSHGSGYVIVVKDKNKLKRKDIYQIKKKLNWWLKEDFAYLSLEFVYSGVKPCIIIEKFLSIDDDLPDYKVMCFQGIPRYIWSDQGRFFDHRRTVYNLDYTTAPFSMHTYSNVKDNNKPENLEEMLKYAKILSEKFSYVRVDFYNLGGKVYFSELTFSSSSGYELPNPNTYDEILGELIELDLEKRNNNYEYRKK